MVADSLVWSVASSTQAPALAREVMRRFVDPLSLSQQRVDDVLLCVSEAVSNVAVHAYRDRARPEQIRVQATVGDVLSVCVSDTGIGLAPRTDSPGAGLGLPLITALAETVQVQAAPGGGTAVIMQFSLASG